MKAEFKGKVKIKDSKEGCYNCTHKPKDEMYYVFQYKDEEEVRIFCEFCGEIVLLFSNQDHLEVLEKGNELYRKDRER